MSEAKLKLRLGTRRSALAMWQAEHVRDLLERHHRGMEVELVPIVTSGDRLLSEPLARIGGKGLFLKEIETALAAGEIDLAVHSAKDVPVTLPEGFVLAAWCSRADIRDAWVARDHLAPADLPAGARVGTSSLRRVAQLRALRPDLDIQPVRGNVGTRLDKLHGGEYAALVLACAGLDRLELADVISARLEPDVMLPAAGQGALAIECRQDDEATAAFLGALDEPDVRACVLAERAVAGRLGADCTLPLAASARIDGGALVLDALVGDPASGELLRESGRGSDAEAVAAVVAEALQARGAQALIERAATYGEAPPA